MKEYSSLRIGGETNMVVVRSEEGLVEALTYARAEGSRIHILGEGTNTYFGDNLTNLLILKMEIMGVEIKTLDGQTIRQSDSFFYVTAGAGERWDDVVLLSVKKELWGLENLSLIPGTVGASPIQNIGAYGVELKDILVSVRVYDTRTESFIELLNQDCEFGYRDSVFKQEPGRYIVVAVTLKLSSMATPVLSYKPLDALAHKENLTVVEVRDLVIVTRQVKLPSWKEYPNAGSFFKNALISEKKGEALRGIYSDIPLYETSVGYKVPTAWLVEHIAQMKGVRVGNIGTWPNQPLVIVNYGESTSADLAFFAETICKKIMEKVDIVLESEVNFVR